MTALHTPPRTVEGEPYHGAAPKVDFRFEVIDGLVVRKPMGFAEMRWASIIHELLAPAVRASGVGECYVDGGFYIPPRNRGRKPDVSVLSFDRWPRHRPYPTGDFLPVAPDLAVEVVSPTDTARAVTLKVREYLAGGVRVVWLVYSDEAEVHVRTPGGADRTFTRGDTLTADPVVPGFALPLAVLFGPADPAPEATS